MEVVHEEDLYQHELNLLYHTDSNFHLKGILNVKMTSWRSKPVAINFCSQFLKINQLPEYLYQ